jgi:hypothetical protein
LKIFSLSEGTDDEKVAVEHVVLLVAGQMVIKKRAVDSGVD